MYLITRNGYRYNKHGRECSACRVWKEWEHFAKKAKKSEVHGRSSTCTDCSNKRARESKKFWDRKPSIRYKRTEPCEYVCFSPNDSVIYQGAVWRILTTGRNHATIENTYGLRRIVALNDLHKWQEQ